jgi:DNA polymerase-3 subunit beta
LSGTFPNYQDIIPVGLNLQLFINRKELLDTVNRACILTDETHDSATFHFNQDVLTITSTNPELGQVQDSVGIDYSGPEIIIRFNPNFFSDLLNNLKSDRVSMHFNETHPAFLFTAPEDRGFTGLIVSSTNL